MSIARGNHLMLLTAQACWAAGKLRTYVCAHDVLLGRGIGGVQQELIGHIVDAHTQVSCGPHVDQLHLVVSLADDHVLGLHVPMNNACPVRCLQSFQNLNSDTML